MKIHAYVYYTEMYEKCLEFDIDVEHKDWMEGVNSGVFYDRVHEKAKETLNKMMDEHKELRYIIDDIGYEKVN
jgi:phenylalanyl-tRNA synthetase alpha subunit